VAIVENTPMATTPAANPSIGIDLGFAAALVIVGFGLTIVIKRTSRPWVPVDPDDDVP
jgi:hypothetical protein